ncbi:MAG: MFS transporter, partial [Deltaproteobacteria bacterium]|nr:MFS transporter [Deltaproteobacteria bacterium]
GVLLVAISRVGGSSVAIRTTGLMIAAMTGLAFFLYRNPEAAIKPVTRSSREGGFLSLLRNRHLLIVSFVMALLGLTQGAIVTFFILYLVEKQNIPVFIAGSLYTLLMLSGTLGRIAWGVISDCFFNARRTPVLMIICLLTTVCDGLLAVWPVKGSTGLLPVIAVLLGLSGVSWNAIGLVLVTELCPGHRTGAAVGLASTIGWSGLFFGPLGFGALLDAYGYFHAWFSMACCGLTAVILCFWIREKKLPG